MKHRDYFMTKIIAWYNLKGNPISKAYPDQAQKLWGREK